MAYVVEAGGSRIGTSELEHADPGMGVLHGRFSPDSGYESLRSVFRMFAEATPETSAQSTNQQLLEQYYRARDALCLRLLDAEGRLIPTTWIHIADFRAEAGPDAIELHVAVADASFWQPRPVPE